MTQDEIMELLEKVVKYAPDEVRLHDFAKLVAAKELEACAKVCDDIHTEYEGDDVQAAWCAAAIRARGQQ